MADKPNASKGGNRRPRTGATSAAATSRREQLRQQQEAEAARARRNRVIVALSAVLALILIAGAVTWAIVHQHNKNNAARAAAITPPSAVGTVGMELKPANGTTATNAPLLYEYQDYQCPTCKQYFDRFGKVFNQLAADGKMRVQYRTLTFLDQNEKNDASVRSAIAAACADTVGAYEAYHDVVYANQPQNEGDGYTDAQLRSDFATKAGITGDNLTKFQKCYDDRATADFVKQVDKTGEADLSKATGSVSTPTFLADKSGTPVKVDLSQVQPTEDAVLAAVKAAIGS